MYFLALLVQMIKNRKKSLKMESFFKENSKREINFIGTRKELFLFLRKVK
jgi:hypothetical protein